MNNFNTTRNRETFEYIPTKHSRDSTNTLNPELDVQFQYQQLVQGVAPSPIIIAWEHPRNNQHILYDQDKYGKSKHPGALDMDIPFRLRLNFPPGYLLPLRSPKICFGFDPDMGFDQWGSNTPSPHGGLTCQSLDVYKNRYKDGIGFLYYTETASASMGGLKVGRRHYKAWISTDEHEILPETMAEVRFVVSDANGFNSVQCGHRNRHFTSITDLRPNEILELLKSVGTLNLNQHKKKWRANLRRKCRWHKNLQLPSYSNVNLLVRSLISSVCSKVVTESGPDILFTNVHEDLFEQRCARGGTNNVVFNTGTRRTNPLEALSLIQVMKYNHNSTSSSSLVIYLSSIPRDIPVLRSLMLFAARLPLDLIVVCDKTCDETTLLVEMEAAQLKSGGHSVITFKTIKQYLDDTFYDNNIQRNIFIRREDAHREVMCSSSINTCFDSDSIETVWVDMVEAIVKWIYDASLNLHQKHQKYGMYLASSNSNSISTDTLTDTSTTNANANAKATSQGTTFSIYHGHDASMTILNQHGDILAVLELERLFERRYYAFGKEIEEVENDFLKGYTELLVQANLEATHVTHAVCVLPSRHTVVLKTVVMKILTCETWKTVGHHESHAVQAFYDAPFSNSALIFSYDGGGDSNQNFEIYLATNSKGKGMEIERIKIYHMNLGYVYMQCATYLSEVTGNKIRNDTAPALHLSGRMMGYVALGKVKLDWMNEIENVFRGIKRHKPALGMLLGNSPTIQDERDFAATAQKVFENILIEIFDEHISLFPGIDGIVVSGGCALNVISNRILQKRYGIPFHVSPSPNDGGLSLGSALKCSSKSDSNSVPVPILYAGPLLFDLAKVPSYVTLAGNDGARQVNVEELADILNKGAIVAIVRGRSEFGPRALGHRSLVAVPHLQGMKERMNRLKYREWWRPVAPMVTIEDARRLFVGSQIWSPYMTFAVKIKNEYVASLPAVVHFDGSARLQTVDQKQNKWLWDLLEAVKKKTGKAMLCNTSFNTRGKPILNRMNEAMKMLMELEDLDYVLVDDVLFNKMGAKKTQSLWR